MKPSYWAALAIGAFLLLPRGARAEESHDEWFQAPSPDPSPPPTEPRGDDDVRFLQEDLNSFRGYVMDGLRSTRGTAFEVFRQLPRNDVAGRCTAHGPGALDVDGGYGGCTGNAARVADIIMYSAYLDPDLSVEDVVALLDAGDGVEFEGEDGDFVEATREEALEQFALAAALLHDQGYI